MFSVRYVSIAETAFLVGRFYQMQLSLPFQGTSLCCFMYPAGFCHRGLRFVLLGRGSPSSPAVAGAVCSRHARAPGFLDVTIDEAGRLAALAPNWLFFAGRHARPANYTQEVFAFLVLIAERCRECNRQIDPLERRPEVV